MYKSIVSVKTALLVVIMSVFGGVNLSFAGGDVNTAALADLGKACAKEINSASQNPDQRNEINAKYNAMRSACSEYRECKRACRKQKQDCKGDMKADKGQCLASCKSIGDKRERKACKKACQSTKKVTKNDCKKVKRSCKEQCRASLLTSECKAARKGFWSSVGKAAERALRSCAEEYPVK